MVITHAEMTDEKVKPVLQTGEALSDARAFPLINAAGKQTGLNLEIIWLLHYWAQNNQGVLIELGDPNNVTTFSESEIYHSLCALVRRLGYDPDQVISSEMPTGNQTGPWKTSVAGEVAYEIAKSHSKGSSRPIRMTMTDAPPSSSRYTS